MAIRIRLMHDLRGMAATNILAQGDRARAPGRAWQPARSSRSSRKAAGPDGRLRETPFELVYLTGLGAGARSTESPPGAAAPPLRWHKRSSAKG